MVVCTGQTRVNESTQWYRPALKQSCLVSARALQISDFGPVGVLGGVLD